MEIGVKILTDSRGNVKTPVNSLTASQVGRYRPAFEGIMRSESGALPVPEKLRKALGELIESAGRKGVYAEVKSILRTYATEIDNEIVLLMLKRLGNLVEKNQGSELALKLGQCSLLMQTLPHEIADTVPELVERMTGLVGGAVVSTQAMASIISVGFSMSKARRKGTCPEEMSSAIRTEFEEGRLNHVEGVSEAHEQLLELQMQLQPIQEIVFAELFSSPSISVVRVEGNEREYLTCGQEVQNTLMIRGIACQLYCIMQAARGTAGDLGYSFGWSAAPQPKSGYAGSNDNTVSENAKTEIKPQEKEAPVIQKETFGKAEAITAEAGNSRVPVLRLNDRTVFEITGIATSKTGKKTTDSIKPRGIRKKEQEKISEKKNVMLHGTRIDKIPLPGKMKKKRKEAVIPKAMVLKAERKILSFALVRKPGKKKKRKEAAGKLMPQIFRKILQKPKIKSKKVAPGKTAAVRLNKKNKKNPENPGILQNHNKTAMQKNGKRNIAKPAISVKAKKQAKNIANIRVKEKLQGTAQNTVNAGVLVSLKGRGKEKRKNPNAKKRRKTGGIIKSMAFPKAFKRRAAARQIFKL